MDNGSEKTVKARFAYLDNIRSLVIILVVAMHVAVTYSGFGGWYYIEGFPENLSIFEMVFFGFFQSFVQAWSMGALFFISAYLTTKALAKRSTANYLKERFFRLGIPLLIYVFFITPFILFVILGFNPDRSFVNNYVTYIVDFSWLGATGPLWFVQVLLLLCIIYSVVKKCIPKLVKLNNLSLINIIFAIIITTLTAFFVRINIPIGSSFLNLQFAYFPSYIVMFIAGLIIGENDLLENITNEKNIKWLKLTLIIGIPLWAAIMIFGGALEGKEYYNGGFNWQNFAFALWESFTAISFSIGLIALFKKRINIKNKFTRLMQDNAFGIYCFHAPILVGISLFFKDLVLNPILKFAMILILASVFCLLFSFLVRKIKPIGLLYK
jgi:surface polysaccharide O-acyltransferase-like enzyme